MDLIPGGWRRRAVPQSIAIEIDGQPVNVAVRVNPRARNLRLSLTKQGPVLTMPKPGHWRSAQQFLDRQRGWLATKLATRSSPYRLTAGGVIPLRGIEHTVVSLEGPRGLVRIEACANEGHQIIVPGGGEHLSRRLTDWLKAQARADLSDRSAVHAERLGVKIAAIRIRDQSTRWGSCSSARVLNYNWRLIMAPPFVLDYVAAHEVAHILEMNHQPAYWRTLARTLPDYARGRDWLKASGAALMAV